MLTACHHAALQRLGVINRAVAAAVIWAIVHPIDPPMHHKLTGFTSYQPALSSLKNRKWMQIAPGVRRPGYREVRHCAAPIKGTP